MQYPCLGIEHHRLYLYILSRAAWIVDFSVLWKRAQGSFVYCREVMAAAGGEIGKVVNVNVGGILYTTTLATLTKVRLVKFYRIDNVEYVYPIHPHKGWLLRQFKNSLHNPLGKPHNSLPHI